MMLMFLGSRVFSGVIKVVFVMVLFLVGNGKIEIFVIGLLFVFKIN